MDVGQYCSVVPKVASCNTSIHVGAILCPRYSTLSQPSANAPGKDGASASGLATFVTPGVSLAHCYQWMKDISLCFSLSVPLFASLTFQSNEYFFVKSWMIMPQ